MDDVPADAWVEELSFMDAWEGGLLPTVSGLLRVRQFYRASPELIAQHRTQQARDTVRTRLKAGGPIVA